MKENCGEINATIYGEKYLFENVPIYISEDKCNITNVLIDKYTIYCYFDNLLDVVDLLYNRIEGGKVVSNNITKELSDEFDDITLPLNKKDGVIILQKQYNSDNVDFQVKINGTKKRQGIYVYNEYYHYSHINDKLKRKINKWLKENGYNITYNDIMKKGKTKGE